MRRGPTRRIAVATVVLAAIASLAVPSDHLRAQDVEQGDESAQPQPGAETPAEPADPEWTAWTEAVLRLDVVDYRVSGATFAIDAPRGEVDAVKALIETCLAEGITYEAFHQRLEAWHEEALAAGAAYRSQSHDSARLRVRPDSYLIEGRGLAQIETPAVSASLRGSDSQSSAWVQWEDRIGPQRCPRWGPRALLDLTGMESIAPWAEPFSGHVGAEPRVRRAILGREARFVLDLTPGGVRPEAADIWQVTFERGHPYAPVAVRWEERHDGEWRRLQLRWFVPDRAAAPLPRLRVALDATPMFDGRTAIRVDLVAVRDIVFRDLAKTKPLRLQLPAECPIHDASGHRGWESRPSGWMRHWTEVLEPVDPQSIAGIRSLPLSGPAPMVPPTVGTAAPTGPVVTQVLIRLDEMWPWWAGVIAIVASCVVLSADPDRRPLRRRRASDDAEDDGSASEAGTETSDPAEAAIDDERAGPG